MKRVKVKKIKVSLDDSFKDEHIAEMFDQMLGNGGAIDLSITYPKYKRLRVLSEQIAKIFEIIACSPFMRQSQDCGVFAEEILGFCSRVRASLGERVDLDQYEWNLSNVPADLQSEFAAAYKALKDSDSTKTFIVLCGNLAPYRRNFEDINSLKSGFILNMSGAEWRPFPFTNLNLKRVLLSEGVGANTVSFFMTTLHKLFVFTKSLYEEVSSPDIDIDKFVDIIGAKIEDLQSHPELSRCGLAFGKIRSSIHLLRTNFGQYYRDFIETKDNTIIMQHFLTDLTKTTKPDAELTFQFQKIIAYHRKVSSTLAQSGKLSQTDKMAAKMLSQFDEIARKLNQPTADSAECSETSVAPSTPM